MAKELSEEASEESSDNLSDSQSGENNGGAITPEGRRGRWMRRGAVTTLDTHRGSYTEYYFIPVLYC